MIEDELRATFARHEALAPAPDRLRAAAGREAGRRRRRRRGIGAAVAALAVLAAVAAPTLGRRLADRPTPVAASPSVAPAGTAVPDRALNFLLLGLDPGAGPGGEPDEDQRADSIMIIHIPRDRSGVFLIAVPRDLAVDIPGHDPGKLSHAFYYGTTDAAAGASRWSGGLRYVRQAVTGLTGLRLDGSVVASYPALRAVTDAVGGVDVCLPKEVRSVHTHRTFPAGCQQLDGAASLDLLRQRYGMHQGGHDRDRNAQRFLRALLGKVTEGPVDADPTRFGELLKAGREMVVDTGEIPLLDLLMMSTRFTAADVTGIGWTFDLTPDAGRQGGLALDPAYADSLFAALRGDTVAEWVRAHPDTVTPM